MTARILSNAREHWLLLAANGTISLAAGFIGARWVA